MNLSLLQKKPTLIKDPFPHVIVEDALPQDRYITLASNYPTQEDIINNREYHPNKRYDLSVDRIHELKLAEWYSFLYYHSSRKFLGEVARLFAEPLYDWYGLTPTMLQQAVVGRRRLDTCEVMLDAQVGINTPTGCTPGSVRGPHVDNPVELYAGLFYLPVPGDDAGGNLELYRYVDKPKIWGKAELSPDCVEKVAEVEYKPNTFVMFLNGLSSVHGVTARQPTDEPRRLVNVIGELNHTLFDLEKYRVEKR